MQSVQVYELTLEPEQTINIPGNSLVVQLERIEVNDGGTVGIYIYLWADHESEHADVTFYVVDTFQELPDTFVGMHIRSVLRGDGSAYHVFMKPVTRANTDQRGRPIIVNPNDPGVAKKRGDPKNGAQH